MEALADPSSLAGVDEHDPQSVARWMKKMGREMGEDLGEGLEEEIVRLHKSCRRLIWLNPLLRWEGFEPKSKGIQAILPHVDEFRPVHNLDSLEQLTQVLSRPTPRKAEGFGLSAPWGEEEKRTAA